MVDATMRSIYSAADETVAALDRLNQQDQANRLRHRTSLESIVAGLGHGSPADTEEPAPSLRNGRLDTDRRPPAPDPQPFVALPQRTTHGGPFGPAVRDKLIAEALSKRVW